MPTIGLISDTHGLLRPEALAALQGCSQIIHAGDIGRPEILERLATIAPVVAVRGNNDTAPWAKTLAEVQSITLQGIVIHVIHDLAELSIDPVAAGVRVVVSGHSHQPSVRDMNGVIYVNPGSAGPRRFKLPISIGRLEVRGRKVIATTKVLAVDGVT